MQIAFILLALIMQLQQQSARAQDAYNATFKAACQIGRTMNRKHNKSIMAALREMKNDNPSASDKWMKIVLSNLYDYCPDAW
jgi:hypothetical protein